MAGVIAYNVPNSYPTYIFRATSGGTVFSSNLTTSTSFDYFDDSAVVNDAIYFSGYTSTAGFSNITVNVGTAMAGTGITVVWEYYCYVGNTWRPVYQLTDNTAGFTVTGVNTVVFPIQPGGMYKTVSTSASMQWVRCRITALTTITEGGANTTDRVTVSDGAITITGYTDDAPCTFKDVYNFCNTYYPQIEATQISSNVYRFVNTRLVINSTLRTTNEVIFMGNGNFGAGFNIQYLWSGTKSGANGWAYPTFFFCCMRSGSQILGCGNNTKVYGGAFYGYTAQIDGLTITPSGNYFGLAAGEFIGVYASPSGYFNTGAVDRCIVDPGIITSTAIASYPTNLQIAAQGSNIWRIYGTSQTIPDVSYVVPTNAIFNFNQYAGGIYDLINPNPAIPSTQSSAPRVVSRDIGSLANPAKVFFYDASAGTYTDYTTAATNVTADDVPINGDVGDCLYIQSVSSVVNQPAFYFTITSQSNDYEYVVEYRKSTGWTTDYGSWDGTSNFTTSGYLWCAAPNSSWATTTINGVSALWTRIRIVTKGTGSPVVSRIQYSTQTGIGVWRINEYFDTSFVILDDTGTPIESADILITDSDGTTYSDTTDSNGEMTSRLKTKYAYFDPLNSDSTSYNSSVKILNPFTVVVSKDGYETYTSTGFTVEGKTTEIITLKPTVPIRQTIEGKLLLASQAELGSSSKLLEI